MKRIAFAIMIFVLAAVAGMSRTMSSWNGMIFISQEQLNQNERNPAAIQKTFDYSHFEGEPLKLRSLKRLINDAKVIAGDGTVGIELGHFVTKGEDGRGQLACEFYGRVQLTFEGEGISEGGEKPMMEVEAPCTYSADINRLEPIWIPSARLRAEKAMPPRMFEASYPENGVHLSFKQMASSWPQQWNLVSVRLFNETISGREVSIGKDDIGEIIEKPLLIDF